MSKTSDGPAYALPFQRKSPVRPDGQRTTALCPPLPFGFPASRITFSTVVSQLGSTLFPSWLEPEIIDRHRSAKTLSSSTPGVSNRKRS